jgi:hypothetical protein
MILIIVGSFPVLTTLQIPQIVITQASPDLLQGRIPRNAFVRHYFRPNFEKENEKVAMNLEKLYKKLEEAKKDQCHL